MSTPDPSLFRECPRCGKPMMGNQTMCWECQDEEDDKKPKMVHPCDGCIHLGHESLTDMGRYRAITVARFDGRNSSNIARAWRRTVGSAERRSRSMCIGASAEAATRPFRISSDKMRWCAALSVTASRTRRLRVGG